MKKIALFKKKEKRTKTEKKAFGNVLYDFKKNKRLLLLITPVLALIIVFQFIPAVYLIAAFKNWRPPQPLGDSKWVGFDHFISLAKYHDLPEMIINTLKINLYNLLLLFVPLIFALVSHHCPSVRVRRLLDVVSIIPFFISSVAIAAMVHKILSPEGLLNDILSLFGVEGGNHLTNGKMFYHAYCLSGCYTGIGMSALYYKSALSGKGTSMHEAAKMDGASLLTRILKIDLPLCLPAFAVNLVLKLGQMLSSNAERLLLYRNTANSSFSSTLDLYSYDLMFGSGIMPNYSRAMALGLMTTVVNIVLVLFSKKISKRMENLYE